MGCSVKQTSFLISQWEVELNTLLRPVPVSSWAYVWDKKSFLWFQRASIKWGKEVLCACECTSQCWQSRSRASIVGSVGNRPLLHSGGAGEETPPTPAVARRGVRSCSWKVKSSIGRLSARSEKETGRKRWGTMEKYGRGGGEKDGKY